MSFFLGIDFNSMIKHCYWIIVTIIVEFGDIAKDREIGTSSKTSMFSLNKRLTNK